MQQGCLLAGYKEARLKKTVELKNTETTSSQRVISRDCVYGLMSIRVTNKIKWDMQKQLQ